MTTTMGSGFRPHATKKRTLFRTVSSEAVKELLQFYDKETPFSDLFRDALVGNNIEKALDISQDLLVTMQSHGTETRTLRDLADEMYFNCRYLDSLLIYHCASKLYQTQTETLGTKLICKGVVNCVLGVLNTMKVLLRHNEKAHVYMENYAMPFIRDILQFVQRLGSKGCVFEYCAWLYYYLGWANLQLGRMKERNELLQKALEEIEANSGKGKDHTQLEIYYLCSKSLGLKKNT